MKRGGPLKRKTALKAGTKTLARTEFKRKTPMPRGDGQLARLAAPLKTSTKKKSSRGLKGRAPTAAEQRFMALAGAQPCMACEIDGWRNHVVSLHHIDGRTKPGAHFQVLPLCPPHHQQDDTDPMQRVSLHGRKATFTARYGTEAELLARLHARLGFVMPASPCNC
jgi:hypothetical protein